MKFEPGWQWFELAAKISGQKYPDAQNVFGKIGFQNEKLLDRILPFMPIFGNESAWLVRILSTNSLIYMHVWLPLL